MVVKSKIKTKVIDHGFNAILRELKKLEYKPYVKIGYPAEKASTNKDHGESDFVTVLEVAIWSEFGTVHMPERSFIRASFDQNRKKYEKLNKELLVKIYSGKMTVEKALDILGFTIENDIKTFLTTNQVEPASFRAIAEGGNTLVDTAQLLNSITFIRVMKS